MPSMAGVGLGPPTGRRFAEIALPLRTLAAVDDPGCHVVREVARVSLVIEGELFDGSIPGVSLFEFVLEVPLAATPRAADCGHPAPGLSGGVGTLPIWFLVGHVLPGYGPSRVKQYARSPQNAGEPRLHGRQVPLGLVAQRVSIVSVATVSRFTR